MKVKEIIKKLGELGFEGLTTDDALLFCEIKINDYWVDCPISERDDLAREYAKKCNLFKNIRKELKLAIKLESEK
jgi:hypothetical protein